MKFMKSEYYIAAMAILAAVITPAIAFAAEEPAKLDSGDTAWMLTSPAIVLLMTIPGIA